MPNLTFFIFFLCMSTNIKSQDYKWAINLSGTGYDYPWDIISDDRGNIYTLGGLQGSTDFDPGIGVFNLTSEGAFDIYISKLDINGKFIWAKRIGSSADDIGYSIALDSQGNVYATGTFTGVVDFDPNANKYYLTSFAQNNFILKLDTNGNFVWAKKFEGSNYFFGHSIIVDRSGNVYTTGYFQQTLDFDPNATTYYLTSNGGTDAFISKLDSSGNFQWAKKIGGASDDGGTSISLDVNQNVYISGSFQDTVDFDPSSGIYPLYAVGINNIFILKLDKDGQFVWVKNFSGTISEYNFSSLYYSRLTLSHTGAIYIMGSFVNTVDFDPSDKSYYLTSNGGYDIYLVKLNSIGEFIWAKKIGEKNDDLGDMVVDANENIILTGTFESTMDIDPGISTYNLKSIGMSDIFISKLDYNGSFLWAKSIGNSGIDYSSTITESNGNIFIAGGFSGLVDFNSPLASNLISNGANDNFIAKYGHTLSSLKENSNEHKILFYPNPTMGNLKIDLGEQSLSAQIIVTNSIGEEIINTKYINITLINLQIKCDPGVYFLTVKTRNKLINPKILKL